MFRRLLSGIDCAGRQIVEITVGGADDTDCRVAEQRYLEALRRLRRTPEFIEVPNEQVYEYPIYQVIRAATVTAEMRLVDVSTGEIVWSEGGLSQTVTRRDTYIEPAPQLEIAGKRALLPDPEHMYAEAVEALAYGIDEAARAFLSRRAEAYLARARRAASSEKAAALYVHYLFDPGPHPATDSVSEALAALCDIDVDAARRERCQQFARARLVFNTQPRVAQTRIPPQPEPRQSAQVAPPRPGGGHAAPGPRTGTQGCAARALRQAQAGQARGVRSGV